MNQKNKKDCLQASLSNLLNIPYKTIPKFYKFYNDSNDNDESLETPFWVLGYNKWLLKIGYTRISIPVSYSIEDSRFNLPFSISSGSTHCLGMLKLPTAKYSHAVLLQISKQTNAFNVEILHDPLFDSKYTIYDLISIDFFFKSLTK